MVDNARALAVVLTTSAVTVTLRLIPFFALDKLSSSSYLRFLGKKMPTGVMMLLVAYTLKDQNVTTYPYGLPIFGAILLSVVLYLKKSNALLSIGLGLTAYMVAVNVIL